MYTSRAIRFCLCSQWKNYLCSGFARCFCVFVATLFLKKLFCSHKKKLGCRLCLQLFRRRLQPSYSCLNQFADFAINFLAMLSYSGVAQGGVTTTLPPVFHVPNPNPTKIQYLCGSSAFLCFLQKKKTRPAIVKLTRRAEIFYNGRGG